MPGFSVKNIPDVELYPHFVVRGKVSRAVDHFENFRFLMARTRVKVCMNEMTKEREIVLPDGLVCEKAIEGDKVNAVENICDLNDFHTKKGEAYLTRLANEQSYHPVVCAIEARPWDGQPRLEQFAGTLRTGTPAFTTALVKRWMVSAIAAAFSPKGHASQGVLVLQGRQNIGKTRWVKGLDFVGNSVIEGFLLDIGNKDSIMTAARHWIAELGELDGTFRKSDIARLKSYVTSQSDTLRLPYARHLITWPRRTVFCATINEERFLMDETGNRRWWTVPVESIDLDHGLDMQQVWAEAHALWLAGHQPWLDREEMLTLNDVNAEHEAIDPLEEKVLKIFNWSGKWWDNTVQRLTATEVLELCGYKQPTRANAIRMGMILTKVSGRKAYKTNGRKLFVVPVFRSAMSVD